MHLSYSKCFYTCVDVCTCNSMSFLEGPGTTDFLRTYSKSTFAMQGVRVVLKKWTKTNRGRGFNDDDILLNQWHHNCKTAFSSRKKFILHHLKIILAQDDVFWLCQKSEKHLTHKKINKSEQNDARFLVKPRDLLSIKILMQARDQQVCSDVTV